MIGDFFLAEIGYYHLTLQWLILPDPNNVSPPQPFTENNLHLEAQARLTCETMPVHIFVLFSYSLLFSYFLQQPGFFLHYFPETDSYMRFRDRFRLTGIVLGIN